MLAAAAGADPQRRQWPDYPAVCPVILWRDAADQHVHDGVRIAVGNPEGNRRGTGTRATAEGNNPEKAGRRKPKKGGRRGGTRGANGKPEEGPQGKPEDVRLGPCVLCGLLIADRS